MSEDTENKPYISDDPEHVAQAKMSAKSKERQLNKDIAELMRIPAFRRFMWWLLEATKLFHVCMTGNSQTFFYLGERNIGLQIFTKLQTLDPDGYALMVKENTEGAKR